MLVKKVKTNLGVVETRLAASWRERNELIALRTDIYKKVGKHNKDAPMTDHWDEKSIIVGIYVNGTPAASARIIDCNPDEEWEHDRFITWNETWPDRNDCIEISRFCVHKKYRNWHIISALGIGLGYAMLRTKKKHAIACCTEDLKFFYSEFFGVHFTGHEIIHEDLGEKTHYMFSNNIENRMKGKSLNFFKWCALWPPVLKVGISQIEVKGKLEAIYLKLILFIGLAISPTVNSLIELSRSNRKGIHK